MNEQEPFNPQDVIDEQKESHEVIENPSSGSKQRTKEADYKHLLGRLSEKMPDVDGGDWDEFSLEQDGQNNDEDRPPLVLLKEFLDGRDNLFEDSEEALEALALVCATKNWIGGHGTLDDRYIAVAGMKHDRQEQLFDPVPEHGIRLSSTRDELDEPSLYDRLQESYDLAIHVRDSEKEKRYAGVSLKTKEQLAFLETLFEEIEKLDEYEPREGELAKLEDLYKKRIKDLIDFRRDFLGEAIVDSVKTETEALRVLTSINEGHVSETVRIQELSKALEQIDRRILEEGMSEVLNKFPVKDKWVPVDRTTVRFRSKQRLLQAVNQGKYFNPIWVNGRAGSTKAHESPRDYLQGLSSFAKNEKDRDMLGRLVGIMEESLPEQDASPVAA